MPQKTNSKNYIFVVHFAEFGRLNKTMCIKLRLSLVALCSINI